MFIIAGGPAQPPTIALATYSTARDRSEMYH